MHGTLSFVASDHGRQIEVRRNEAVPDDFWRKVRSEWGQRGARPSEAILVPTETFASRQSWLPPACRRYGVAVDLDPETRAVVMRGRADRARLKAVRESPPHPSPGDGVARLHGTRFVRELLPFQKRDLAKLLVLDHGANFSIPGAGKTTVELAVYEAERAAGRVERLLVVAPLSAFEAWMEESALCLQPAPLLHRYTGGGIPSAAEIVLVNYQRLTLAYDEVAAWVAQTPTLIVLDEAHRMKRGRDGEWGTACLDLAFLAARRDVLTGTPAPQHPWDLAALLDYLWPGQAQRVLPAQALIAHPSDTAISQVTSAISPLFVRTTKHELQLRDTVSGLFACR